MAEDRVASFDFESATAKQATFQVAPPFVGRAGARPLSTYTPPFPQYRLSRQRLQTPLSAQRRPDALLGHPMLGVQLKAIVSRWWMPVTQNVITGYRHLAFDALLPALAVLPYKYSWRLCLRYRHLVSQVGIKPYSETERVALLIESLWQ
jgi:hypothetical protein